MLEVVVGAVMTAFADDIKSVRKCETLRPWWGNLVDIGPSFRYLPQPKKSWLIVKQNTSTKLWRFSKTQTYKFQQRESDTWEQ